MRRKESKGKDIDTGFEDISTGFEDISTGFEEVNTGGLGVSTGSGPVSSARGQREGKAPMIVEETQAPKRTKEQIQQEEANWKKRRVNLTTKKRNVQVPFESSIFYTKEDWDAIRAKFRKQMQRKKHFAEERAKAKRNKPMTQSQLRIYMSNYLKNQGTWKLSQLKKLKFKEIKEEFEKLVKQIDTFVPINIEATKAQLKRYGEELQTEISKKQMIDDKDVSDIEEKVETDKEESVEAMNPTPLDTKSNIVANWKIFQQGERSIYQIIRANGADTVYMSFGAMLKDFTREDLIELYRLVMQKYGTNRPEDAYDRVLWSDLRTMFDPPLNEDAIWSLPLQQKMINRKYPLSKDVCQVMLKMKLLDGKMNEVCYKLLKMIEKQAGLATPEQTATGKEYSNPLIADDLLKIICFVDLDHPKKFYKVVKALYGLHQVPRAWYATLSTFLEKHGYRRGTIDKTLFIKKDKKDIMLLSIVSMGELIFFLGLQVKQKTDGIFISQDKYVADMLKKFDLASVKTAITLNGVPKMAFTKDEEG
ncbi:putative ribonuclease H-like domain-containing protein [Tanacetum coccineum]